MLTHPRQTRLAARSKVVCANIRRQRWAVRGAGVVKSEKESAGWCAVLRPAFDGADGMRSEPQNEATREVLLIYAVVHPRELAPVVNAMSVALVSETLREDRSKFLRR